MKNIFMRDTSTCHHNVRIMENLFDHYIGDVVIFGDYDVNDLNIGALEERFDKVTGGEDVNLICHSMGCNYGVILSALQSSKIHKLVLISPKIYKPTLKEQIETTIYSSFNCSKVNYEEKRYCRLDDFIKNNREFNMSSELARKYLKQQFDIKSLIIYGRGDRLISKTGIYELSKSYDSRILEYPTCVDNILMSAYDIDALTSIKDFIEDKPKTRKYNI